LAFTANDAPARDTAIEISVIFFIGISPLSKNIQVCIFCPRFCITSDMQQVDTLRDYDDKCDGDRIIFVARQAEIVFMTCVTRAT
jgi:hypothetical protein